MSVSHTPRLSVDEYERLAWEYYKTLPMEHFMESTSHATQRAIVVASMELLAARGVNVTCFNELLVHYWHNDEQRYVVPDNMLVIDCDEKPARISYAMEHESAEPFMMLEYVSESNNGEKYLDCFRKYERELRTPYCLMFREANLDLRPFHHDGESYVPMEQNAHGRYEVPELELEFARHKGWVRFWYRGELLEIPIELHQRLDQLKEHVHQQAATIKNLENQVASMTAILRSLAASKARQANRKNIVAKIAEADLAQLQACLAELDAEQE